MIKYKLYFCADVVVVISHEILMKRQFTCMILIYKSAVRFYRLEQLEDMMVWVAPECTEVCVGMEVTSYLSAEI